MEGALVKMKFSFFMMPLHLPTENPSLAFQRDIDMVCYADDLGYDEFYIGEHHTAAWESIPAPDLVLAKASATAKRIKLGTALVSLPFHHPFHVAERMAFLDHLTDGRVILGVGPNSLPPDIKLFGVPATDLRPMMDESLEIIVKLLESPDPINVDGRFWKIKDMALQLRSYQQPRLKLATATTGSKRSLGHVAKYQMILLSPPTPGDVRRGTLPVEKHWDAVEEAAIKYGTQVSRDDWRIVTYVYLADTREQAWADVESSIKRDVHDYFYVIGGPASWLIDPGQAPEDLTPQQIVESKCWIIGTPDDAIKAIEKLDRDCGGIGGIMMTTHEWVPQAKINYSLELFARYVMPHFQGRTNDLKREWKRTQRYRRDGLLPSLGGPPEQSPSLDEHKSNVYFGR